jgi:hypothetical protein
MDYGKLSDRFTFDDLLSGFREVLQKLQHVRSGLAVPESDGRQVPLYGMQEVFFGFGLTVHAIVRSRNPDQVLDSFTNFGTFAGKTQDQLVTVAATAWRLSSLTLFHFKLDALFQNLLRAFGEEPGKSGFGQNSTALLAKVTLADPKRAKRILEVITDIRNSMHDNGIHRGSDRAPFSAHGLTYEFRKDHDVRCASFGHILGITDSTVDVLEGILSSPIVKGLSKVEDRYAALNPWT